MSPNDSSRCVDVLLLTRNRELGLLRQKVLEMSGCRVTFPESREAALEALTQRFDAMVITYTISTKSAQEYCDIFRRHNPKSRIVYISAHANESVPSWAHESVVGLEGPEEMIRAVKAQAGD